MRLWLGMLVVLSLVALIVAEQQPGPGGPAAVRPQDSVASVNSSAGTPDEEITLPAGTTVPLVLKQAISTKDAHIGDLVYAQTNSPVSQNGHMLIPPGTYVQGVISNVKRGGRVKGRAEVRFHFTTLIFPNGYTVTMPGSVQGVPGAEHSHMKGAEGTVQQDGERGKDVGEIAGGAATGAAIGAIAAYSGDVNDGFQRHVNGHSGDVNKAGAKRRWDCNHARDFGL